MNEIEKDLKSSNIVAAEKKQAFNEGNTDNNNQLTDDTKVNDKVNKTPIDKKTNHQ